MIQHSLYIILSVFCLSGFTKLPAQTRRALFIGINNYPKYSEWNSLHADNDSSILYKAFTANHLQWSALRNERATKAGIIAAFNRQLLTVQPKDTLLIHFSCHGQQMEDDNADEADCLDEALIPYDAEMRYEKGYYEGEHHLRDDELNQYLIALRRKIGKQGLVIVSLDACHAASGTRKEKEEFVRGTDYVFSPSGRGVTLAKSLRRRCYVDAPLEKSKEWAPIIVISACKSYQKNTEVKVDGKYYGALSYYLYRALSHHILTDTRLWLEMLERTMRQNLRHQSPVIETTLSDIK